MASENNQQAAQRRSLSLYLTVQTAIVLAMLILSAIDLHQNGDDYESSTMPYIGDLLDFAGRLAFTTLAVHVVWQFRLSWRQRCLTTIAYLLLYVLSYSMLSSAGQYHASRSGHHRWNGTGLAVVDEKIWHATAVFWQPFTNVRGERTSQATLLGHFYSPLVRADRRFRHDSYNMFDDDLDEWLGEHADVRQDLQCALRVRTTPDAVAHRRAVVLPALNRPAGLHGSASPRDSACRLETRG